MTQPTEQQAARDDLYDALDQSWYRWDPQSMAKGTGIIRLIDAHAAEVRAATLREAAELGRELSRQGYSAQEIANRLDRMAEEARS
ncbi:hypothetical protein ACH4TP_38020 [Streptomyces sp. NPDC021012]|uniref:hypothetical protein n=1 Tax=Streptomyces sp. NPDC021012 TaxID=3365107 RepID=UPI0037903543